MSGSNVISPAARSGYFANTTRRFFNASTAATVVGGVYQLDLGRTVASTSGAADPLAASLRNLINPATAGLGYGLFVVARDVVPNLAEGLFFGGVGEESCLIEQVLVNGSSTAIAINDKLQATNGSNKLTRQASAAGTGHFIAIALAAATTDNALIPCLFFSRPRLNL